MAPQKTSRSIIALVCGLLISTPLAASQWEVLPESAHDVELTTSAEDATVVGVRTSGGDPFLIGRWKEKPGRDDRILEFEYFCPAGVTSFSALAGPPFSESDRAELPDIPIAEGWRTYTVDLMKALGGTWPEGFSQLRLDFGQRPNRRIRIRGVRLRPQTEAEIRGIAKRESRRERKLAEAKSVSNYLQTAPPATIDAVVVGDQLIELAGPEPKDSDQWQLIEYPASRSITDEGFVVDAIVDHSEGHFQIAIPRRADSCDRLHSGWRLRDGSGRYLTARHYATEIQAGSGDFAAARLTPASQKGLTCFSRRGPQQELLDLGITAVTINLVLSPFISLSPGPGKTRIAAPGQPVFFNEHAFGTYDSLIDFARQYKIVVSAIVLIPRQNLTNLTSPLIHPESDGGIYAMPDMSTKRGVAIYAHVLDQIADRYSNTRKAPGGITNWIAHNEVDFHNTWTNMGAQPREVLTETYYRSMRMIHNAARLHNPHARVFASLTHHWIVPPDGKWQQLAPREFLTTLQQYSSLEGDFAWGVAYHPYPESLFADVAWEDKNVDDTLDTPFVTMQNLEVLGKFLEQPSMRTADGKMRPVLLSEQGYHTDSYDQAAQADQAASLWFAMKKVRSLPWVESFHYHRWIDHPGEGGLKLGLRTLPSRQYRYGEKKRSWYVYQAIGTEQEEELTKDLPQ